LKQSLNDQKVWGHIWIFLRGSAIPHGDGIHYMVVNKLIRAAIGVAHGDIVQVVLEKDLEARSVVIPEDLVKASEANGHAKMAFEALSYSHQKQYVEWIEGAKSTTTRQNRITKAIEMLPKEWNPKKIYHPIE